MKLRNKKTGDIAEVLSDSIAVNVSINRNDLIGEMTGYYTSLAELNEEWEDAPEEPKEYWYLDMDGDIRHTINPAMVEYSKEIGNYFETKEEAEKAVEKLKAWKRLKENRVHFDLATLSDENVITIFARKKGEIHKYDKELDLLFGGDD